MPTNVLFITLIYIIFDQCHSKCIKEEHTLQHTNVLFITLIYIIFDQCHSKCIKEEHTTMKLSFFLFFILFHFELIDEINQKKNPSIMLYITDIGLFYRSLITRFKILSHSRHIQHDVILHVQIWKTWQNEHVITIGTIQKIKNTIYIGTLTIEDKTIYMRTRKT